MLFVLYILAVDIQRTCDFLPNVFFSPCSTFNWTVPFCSYLMCVIFTLGTVVLYLVPLKFLLLAWGKVFFHLLLNALFCFTFLSPLEQLAAFFFALILLFFFFMQRCEALI